MGFNHFKKASFICFISSAIILFCIYSQSWNPTLLSSAIAKAISFINVISKAQLELTSFISKILQFSTIRSSSSNTSYDYRPSSGICSGHYVSVKKSEGTSEKIPVILTWTPYYSNSLASFLDKSIANCHYNCIVTKNRSYLESSDAVVIHIRDLNLSDLPKNRFAGQFYVFFLLESPYNTGRALNEMEFNKWQNSLQFKIPDDYFNLTMTYRKDGDILAGYGKLINIRAEETEGFFWDYDEIVKSFLGRNKSVLQFVSHCNTDSEREFYVDELKYYIDVTQIGACGIRNCSSHCEETAMKEHKFYLSFENSICRDYITEKLFSRLGNFLPIVLKRSTYKGIIPDDAFIAADDFKSPKELAEYLKFLNSNHTALIKYFEWTKNYKRVNVTPGCDLCGLLHKNNGKKKLLNNLRKWWFENGKCESHYVTNLFKKNDYSTLSRNVTVFNNR